MGDSKYEKWEKFGASDLYAYFGIMILMGLVDLPYLYNYWSKDKIFCYPAIAEKMARDRFIDIHKYLHFTNNEAHGSDLDHLWKVREVLSMIKRFCLYNQNRECPIDKVMVPYKGNSSLKQYMPKKPVRRGLKVSTVSLHEVQRKMKTGEHCNFSSPHAIITYNKYMGGVNRNHQVREYDHVRIKSRLYYKYLFWMVLDIAVTNSLTIAKTHPDLQDVKSTKAFRTALSQQLLDGYCSKKGKGRRPSESTKNFRMAHYPLFGDGNQYIFHYCSLQKNRKDTKWFCEECNNYLHHKGQATGCFLQYDIHHVGHNTAFSTGVTFTYM
uniref:PiggyBac transposable element-derived protein domain-containing protein n=1 Tax=Amphimedon queenslandica TaxID=400682 RepID=A0A1X7VGU7_AMPQE